MASIGHVFWPDPECISRSELLSPASSGLQPLAQEHYISVGPSPCLAWCRQVCIPPCPLLLWTCSLDFPDWPQTFCTRLMLTKLSVETVNAQTWPYLRIAGLHPGQPGHHPTCVTVTLGPQLDFPCCVVLLLLLSERNFLFPSYWNSLESGGFLHLFCWFVKFIVYSSPSLKS